MRDPRSVGAQTTGAGTIEPWLAVNGSYDTYIDQPAGAVGSVNRSVSLAGGLSMAKSFHRTVVVLGYAGAGHDYFGASAATRKGWLTSNVASLTVSTQATRRMTLDFTEMGGAGNGGFGSASSGMLSGGLGLLGSLGVASSYLFGGIPGLGGTTTGINPLQNGLVDADYYTQMAYFSSTSAGAGFLLSSRTMLNVSGSAAFVRRDGLSYSDSNMLGATAMMSTQLSRRFATFFGYSYQKIDFIKSTGSTSLQAGFAGIDYILSPHDQFSLSASGGYMDSQFIATVALPPDVAALLGVATTTTVSNNQRTFIGGRLNYNHTFERGGFDLTCNSTIAPGNELILLARTEGCSIGLSRRLTPRFSVHRLAKILDCLIHARLQQRIRIF